METLNPKSLQNQYQNQNPTSTQTKRRPPKPKPQNPIETAISTWFHTLPASLIHELNNNNNNTFTTTAQPKDPSKEDDLLRVLIATAPKRWVVYPPMVLLPSGSFSSFAFGSNNNNSSEKVWEGVFEILREERRQDEEEEKRLWRGILHGISMREGKGKGRLTHLAVNAGIPLNQGQIRQKEEGDGEESEKEENILRSPSGLIMLHGDFGPALSPGCVPSEKDFEDAFWVTTRQNGIFQSWAPRYTMFSRGNVKEKARLLGFHSFSSSSSSESSGGDGDGVGSNGLKERLRSRQELGNQMAVDLYAGIGYFVFSYVKMGMGKVVGWELNPWSVEGLRRGAVGNGWSVRVVKDEEEESLGGLDSGEEIVVFLEDNREAGGRLRGWKGKRDVSHVNCGLLPTSEMSWEMGLGMVDNEGWLHLHENVGVADIERRKRDIEELFRGWLKRGNDDRDAIVDHVELVKTFAPGVWHCVFDVHICRKSSGS